MKRDRYIQPECTLVPLHSSDNLMGIGGTVGTSVIFGKETDFDGFDFSKNDSWGVLKEYKVEFDDVWDGVE